MTLHHEAQVAIDLESLVVLLANVGIDAARLEAAIHQELVNEYPESGKYVVIERGALDAIMAHHMARLQREQDPLLRSIGLAMSGFRHEAAAYQRTFILAVERNVLLMAAIVFLQLVVISVLLLGKAAAQAPLEKSATRPVPNVSGLSGSQTGHAS